MRQRMADAHPNRPSEFDLKHDRGGLIDVEFIVQYLVLGHAHQHASPHRQPGQHRAARDGWRTWPDPRRPGRRGGRQLPRNTAACSTACAQQPGLLRALRAGRRDGAGGTGSCGTGSSGTASRNKPPPSSSIRQPAGAPPAPRLRPEPHWPGARPARRKRPAQSKSQHKPPQTRTIWRTVRPPISAPAFLFICFARSPQIAKSLCARPIGAALALSGQAVAGAQDPMTKPIRCPGSGCDFPISPSANPSSAPLPKPATPRPPRSRPRPFRRFSPVAT